MTTSSEPEGIRSAAEAEVERLPEPGRIGAAVAAVTPCSCSAQRARAEAAEAKLAAVRALVDKPLGAGASVQAVRAVLAILDGGEPDER